MTDVLEIARVLAYRKHAGQMYGDKPYQYHLNAVMESVARKWGWHNKDILAIAILHDILEDTDTTYEDLVAIVGKDIARCVRNLTKFEEEPYEVYMCRVKQDHYSKEVKIHDTLCNLTESIMADSKGRVKKYSNQLHLLVG